MKKRNIKLCNTVDWDPRNPDKVYLECLQIAVGGHWFEMRQVFLRFIDGPRIDLSTYDADRIVAAYLRLRGLKPPSGLARGPKSVPCDFEVPGAALRSMLPSAGRAKKARTGRK